MGYEVVVSRVAEDCSRGRRIEREEGNRDVENLSDPGEDLLHRIEHSEHLEVARNTLPALELERRRTAQTRPERARGAKESGCAHFS